MKTITLLLAAASVTCANTLPPVPENTLPPTWELTEASLSSIEA